VLRKREGKKNEKINHARNSAKKDRLIVMFNVKNN